MPYLALQHKWSPWQIASRRVRGTEARWSMLSRGAVLLNRLINRQVGLCGCVQTQLELEVIPYGAVENPDTLKGKGCRYLVAVKGIVMEKLWKERVSDAKCEEYYCREEVGRDGETVAEWKESVLERWKVEQSVRRGKQGKDWLSWPKVREGERERGFYRIWKLGYLAECVVAAVFWRDDTPGSWSVLMWTQAGSFMWTSAQRQ